MSSKNKKFIDSIEAAARNQAIGINAYYLELDNKNRYASLIYDLYEACYIKTPTKYTTPWKYFGKPFEVNIDKYKQIERCEEFVASMVNHSPDFNELFEFGSFIKYMEKVFFYKNDSNADVCCDSNIDDKNHRIIVFQSDDIKISIDVVKATSNIITLTVTRFYGKNMINTYKIIDREVELRNDSDKTLMNHVVQLISNYMVAFMLTIIYAIINKKIDKINPIEFEYLKYYNGCIKCNCRSYYSNYFDPYESEEYKNLMWLEKHKLI